MPKTILFVLLVLGFTPFAAAQKAAREEHPLVVRFGQPGGFYGGPVTVSLDAGGAAIYFSTDGSYPNQHTNRYTRPFTLERTAVVRAIARRGNIAGKPFSQTYLIDEPPTDLPVISVAIAPGLLFNPETGIMVDGPGADSALVYKPGANFWTRQEFSCNVEIFESDKKSVFNSGAGIRLFGGYSRIYPQKSLVLVARDRYGKKFFRHRFFGANAPKKFRYLVLRNGGSDWNGAHCRDELMNRLTEGWDLEKQAFRPALLYLNGRYWGLYHLREKINPRFLEDHADVDRDSLDLMEHQRNVRHGNGRHYQRLINYIQEHDLSDPAHYAWVQSQMDVENYLDYMTAQIYCDNTDAGGNIRYWRPKRPGGRWRWILFDTDWGFGLYNPQAWQHDAIQFFTDPDGPKWPNPPWSTFLLRSLLKNKDFEQQFINRLCDRLNTSLSAQNTLAEIAWFERSIGPEMPRHLQRWRQAPAEWQRQMSMLHEFAEKRPGFLRTCLTAHFDTGLPAGLDIEPAEGGTVLINNCVTAGPAGFHGQYFEKIPVALLAVPAFGYRFVGWDGAPQEGRLIRTNLVAGATLRLRPRFEPHRHPLIDQVFINEICPAGQRSGDWIEILNNSGKTARLDAWMLTDYRHEWQLPDVSIPPHGHLVLCQDTAAFRQQFPKGAQVIGDFRFGLDKNAERLALFAADGAAVDSVAYYIEPPEGEFTLDLLMPSLNNDDARNWGIHVGPGSPGQPNPMYWSKVISEKKDRWLRIGLAIGLLIVVLVARFMPKMKA